MLIVVAVIEAVTNTYTKPSFEENVVKIIARLKNSSMKIGKSTSKHCHAFEAKNRI